MSAAPLNTGLRGGYANVTANATPFLQNLTHATYCPTALLPYCPAALLPYSPTFFAKAVRHHDVRPGISGRFSRRSGQSLPVAARREAIQADAAPRRRAGTAA
ncbi:hypothetical protein BQ8482_220172 [Mesorhizobium delmotii]|uniref:Uncharacterized protein n=1 Tax=Mesorhizobium delmotii TaxID=1631247 RepID=A0A2P9ALI4_9HYPH|nr:hypothetical protein BQ8482_220172 [Mesorhizobium delmotii]